VFEKKKKGQSPDQQVGASPPYEFVRKEQFSLRDLLRLNETILEFLDEETWDILPFAPMSKTQQAQLRILSGEYNLKSSFMGSGSRRLMVISKTNFTCVADQEEISQLIPTLLRAREDQQNQRSPQQSPQQQRKPNKKKNKKPSDKRQQQKPKTKNHDKRRQRKSEDNQSGSPLVSGKVVAQDAKPIDESNVGNRLLRSMGWQGGSLGTGSTGEGIVDPIEAIFKNNKKGLGYL
jgi:hypothetical protein